MDCPAGGPQHSFTAWNGRCLHTVPPSHVDLDSLGAETECDLQTYFNSFKSHILKRFERILDEC